MTLPILPKTRSLRRKLMTYMLALAVLLGFLLFAGIYLIGGFTGTKQKLYDTLDFQTDVFARQVTTHYDGLAAMGIQLSEKTTALLEEYLAENGLSFADLQENEEHLAAIQELLIDPLHHKMQEADCTGAFILLDTQVNSTVANAATSRSGIYLQHNSLDATDSRTLLYRGLADVGKRHEAMPHRKWRLEFDTTLFPDYDTLAAESDQTLGERCRVSDAITLPGTSERVMLVSLPILGADGEFYGLCGFEVSESYFKTQFAQPSELDRPTFCLNRGEATLKNAENCFSAGVADSYYLTPRGLFHSEPFGSGLITCESEQSAYVGVTQSIRLTPGGEAFSISTLIPRQDYNRIAARNAVRIVLLLAMFAVSAVSCCLYFSRRYLKPVKESLERIRRREYEGAPFEEIDDLFAFLAEQDRVNEAAIDRAEQEKANALASLEQMQEQHNAAQRQLARLAYSRKSEVDPADYENFRSGLHELTETERRVFDYYLAGKSVKEIIELMGVRETTIRFHNRNIYAKLGVNSLKQLLRCAAILQQEEGGGHPEP